MKNNSLGSLGRCKVYLNEAGGVRGALLTVIQTGKNEGDKPIYTDVWLSSSRFAVSKAKDGSDVLKIKFAAGIKTVDAQPKNGEVDPGFDDGNDNF